MQKRGGKRVARKKVTPGGNSGREPYWIQVVEVYMRIGGTKHSSSYSIAKHGTVGAHRLADAWLVKKRAEAAQ